MEERDRMSVYFVRHVSRPDFVKGIWSDAFHQQNPHTRIWDPPLTTPEGPEQAHACAVSIGKCLDVDSSSRGQVLLLSSPFRRCVETAVAISRIVHSEVIIEPFLCEHMYQKWFGAVPFKNICSSNAELKEEYAEVALNSPFHFGLALTEWEEEESTHRAERIASCLYSFNGPSTIIIVTHGGVIDQCLRFLVPDVKLGAIGYGATAKVLVNLQKRCSELMYLQMPFQFTKEHNWHDRHLSLWENVVLPQQHLFIANKVPLSILEIGVWEGRSAIWFLQNMLSNPKLADGSHLVCIDHFDMLLTSEGRERRCKLQFNLQLVGNGHLCTILEQFSVPALMGLLQKNSEFDIIYIDGSHSRSDVLLDALLAWKCARQGAIVIFDDYQWTNYSRDHENHPQEGIDAFLKIHRHEIEVLHRGYQIIVRKRTPVFQGICWSPIQSALSGVWQGRE